MFILKEQYKQYLKAKDKEKEKIGEEIFKTLRHYGYKKSHEACHPISKDTKKLVRIEFYGTVDKIKDDRNFSEEYKYFVPENKLFDEREYNELKDWPLWQICEQSKKFREIRGKLISYFIQNSMPVDVVNKLNVYDFQDVLYKAFHDERQGKKVKIFEGKKAAFTKYLATKHGRKIKEIFIGLGVSEKNIKKTLSVMKSHGVTDIYYKDDKGYIFDATDHAFGTHHIEGIFSLSVASKETPDAKFANPFEANYFENLCLMINSNEFPLHNIIHIFDNVKTLNTAKGKPKIEQIIEKLLTPQNAVFVAGIHPAFCICDDFSAFEKLKNKNKGGAQR